MNYVYLKSEPCLYTVGFYDPSGKWQPESDHTTPSAAAQRVAFLNGGSCLQSLEWAIETIKRQDEPYGHGPIEGFHEGLATARAAIAKAKGGGV